MFKKILVATDGSPLSQKAVDCAIDMARAHGAELLAVNVVPRYPTSFFEGAAHLSAEEVGAVERRWAQRAQGLLEDVVERARASGVEAKTATPIDDFVAQALIHVAKKHRCDLIVMASHGRKGIGRLLLGSETQQLLVHSSLPVLVLR
jgi:nucleotide-binding universal stress UspA family protein